MLVCWCDAQARVSCNLTSRELSMEEGHNVVAKNSGPAPRTNISAPKGALIGDCLRSVIDGLPLSLKHSWQPCVMKYCLNRW